MAYPKRGVSRKPVRPAKRHRSPLRTVLACVLIACGLTLFAAGYVGAQTGITILPFDPHHIIAQAGGLAIAFLGAAKVLK